LKEIFLLLALPAAMLALPVLAALPKLRQIENNGAILKR
jgi:hypothetical protein